MYKIRKVIIGGWYNSCNQVHTPKHITYRISLSGKLIDSFLNLARARIEVKRLGKK